METIYRLILRKALKISWKNKWLWVLGFFAAVIGNGSVYEALLRGFNNISEGRSVFYTFREYLESGIFGMISWAKLSALWESDASAFGLGIFTILLMMCLLAILITLGVIGQGGVVSAVINLDEDKKPSMKSSFRVGVERFWPILELNVMTKVVLLGFLLFLAYLVSLLTFTSEAAYNFVYVLAFIVFVILGIIIYFLTIYGTAYVILRGKGSFGALKSAWRLFSKHVLLNLEMGLLLFVVNIVVAILFFLLNFMILSPIFVLYLLFLFSGVKIITSILMFIMLVIFAVTIFAVGSWWSSFQLGVWAILFEELELKGGKSKVQRWFELAGEKIKSKKAK